ncbi:ABC transporter ATP-binding protein [Actinokineospora sp. HUAS TT18]|uniref:ABC transporter ATP-binding protein n=1 Tax=Actinokineospora sp. HUAS TT18 TaxID=3447451 RepID=UPI003F523CF3
MTDLFAGLKADDYDRAYTNGQLLSRIHGYLRADRTTLVGAAGLIVGASLLMSAVPVVISRAIDSGGLGWQLGAIVVAMAVVGWGLTWARQALTARLVADVVYRLQLDAADAALAKDAAFYDRNSVGQVLSRVSGDTEGFSSVLTLTLNFLSQLFLVVVLGTLVFVIDVNLGLLLLAMVPLLVAATLAFRRVARVGATNTRRVMAQVNAHVHETMVGIAVAKSFGQEQTVYRDFDDVNRLSYTVYLRQGLIYAVILPVLTLLAGLGSAALLYAGGRFTALGELSPGEWYFAVTALGMVWLPLTQAASFWSLFQQGLAASERVFALVDSADSVEQTGAEPVGRLRGEIELRNLDFCYDTGEKVFHDLSLRIEPRQTVAVVGHTGAGKSTLAKLIARAYEFDGGELLIDGRDIRSFDLAEYRRQVGVVPQHPYLFSGTVKANIDYAGPGDSTVDSLDPSAPVGRGGQGVSVGQRQLISLARVFRVKPSILILDEPTASVDPLTEKGIQHALAELMADRTVIVIAHRLSTIRKADRVLVFDRGDVVEDGTFAELLAKDGHFTELYRTYYAHQED